MTEQQTTEVRGAATPSNRWVGVLPVIGWLPRYRKAYLTGDLLAGLVVAALAVPQALGYAGIAGVPVIVGLYSIPLALVAYAIFGSSPHLVVGPVSTVSVLSGALVADISHGDQSEVVALTSALALGAGVGLVIGGVARLGWAAEFLSRPIVTGFVFGLVLLIILGEIPSLLGMPSVSGDVIGRVGIILRSFGHITPLTAAIGIAALAILFVGARFAPRVPWGLLVLVGAIILSGRLDWAADGVVTVGPVPQGLPPISIPSIDPGQIPAVVTGGLAMALVGLAEGLSAARIFAAREGYSIKANQELVGTGVANMASGFSGGMGVAGSLSKTAASRRSGGETQLTGVFGAVIVLLVLAFLTEWLAPLPRTVLSAIVIQAVWGLMDLSALRRYQSIRRNDFNAAIAAMIGVLLLGPLYGLLVAVALAVLGLVYRSSRADLEIMGKVPEEKAAWGSIRNHPDRRTYDGVIVIRLDAPLFWANSAEVCDRVLESVDADPDVKALVLDLEATSQLDTTSIDALELLLARLKERGVELYLVRVFYRARRVLAKSGFVEELGPEHMWHSIAAGVRAARKDAALKGKSHSQPEENEDDDTSAERIAVEETESDDENGDGERAPRGGYQDPYRTRPRKWWHLG
ncbi:MAG: sulfate permease [Candidatus Nanopelagicales bacterium]